MSTMNDSLPDPIAQNVRNHASKVSQSEEEVADAVVSTYETLPDDLPEDTRWDVAFKRGKKSLVDQASLSGSAGDAASVITVGHGRVMGWPDKNHDDYREGMSKDAMPRKDVLIASGIVREESTGKTDVASIIFDSTDGLDLGEVMDAFRHPYRVYTGRFNFNEPNKSSSGFVLYSTSATELESVDDPMPVEERKQLVEKYVDDVDIATLASNPHGSLSLSDGNGAADFGIDLKRISGATIYDHWINDDNERGVYTILDDSVVGPEELEGSQLDSDKQRVAGLSAWSHANLMEYDTDSICDFYGTLQEDWNGQITMEVRAIDPVFAEELNQTDDVGSQTAETF